MHLPTPAAFTYCALEVLRKSRDFPDLERFQENLDSELEACRLDRFLLAVKSEKDDYETLYGVVQKSEDEIANSLLDLLIKLHIPRPISETHFFATARAMNNDRLFHAQGITGMVRELSGLRDPNPGATHGIVQFVLRLHNDPVLEMHRSALARWLELHSNEATVDDERARLTAESGGKLLIFDMEVNELGEVASLKPMLRNRDQTQVRGRIFNSIAVRSWQDVEHAVVSVLKALKDEELANDLEIDFIIEKRLFDRPFHRLPGLEDGCKLGEEYVLVLHHRDRVRPGASGTQTPVAGSYQGGDDPGCGKTGLDQMPAR